VLQRERLDWKERSVDCQETRGSCTLKTGGRFMEIDPVDPMPVTPPPVEEAPEQQNDNAAEEVPESPPPPPPEDTGKVVDQFA
jgi:hypothetical protein